MSRDMDFLLNRALGGTKMPAKEEQIRKVEKEIEDLKKRMPAHSVKPDMIQRLEELEEKLERLKKLE